MSPSDKRPVRRPKAFGVALLDDIVVDVVGTFAQVGIVAIMLPVLLVAFFGSVIIAVLIGGVMAAVLKELGAPAQVLIIPGAVALIAALTATALIGIKVYRRLPRDLRTVAFDEYEDSEPAPEDASQAGVTTSPSLAELDARLAPGWAGEPTAPALEPPPAGPQIAGGSSGAAAPSALGRAARALAPVVGGVLGVMYALVVADLVGDGPLWAVELPLIAAAIGTVVIAVRSTSRVIERAAGGFGGVCVLFALLFLGAN